MILGGCAGVQKQAFNKDANQRLKTIGFLEQIEQEKYFVQNMGHPGMGFGLIGLVHPHAGFFRRRGHVHLTGDQQGGIPGQAHCQLL